MKPHGIKKIAWAVDALDDSDQHGNVLSLLRGLAKATSAAVEPVFVLSTPYANTKAAAAADFEQAYHALAEKRLAELGRISEISGMVGGKILVNRDGSIRKDAQMLIKYAEAQQADAVVVATHARKGAARLFMGSFAESIALYSRVPVITVNPKVGVNQKISNVLFPTPFFARFRPVFERAVDLCKAVGAKITLYYKEPVLPTPMMNPEVYNYLAQESMERKKIAEEWRSWAEQNGVSAEVNIDEQPGYVPYAIEELALAKGFDLIAMGTQADTVSSILMGSVTRQVIRQAHCPVWVMHTTEQA